jgi:hypothetical protein
VKYINTTTIPISSFENIHRLKMHSTQIDKGTCIQTSETTKLALSRLSCKSENVNFQINKYWDPSKKVK